MKRLLLPSLLMIVTCVAIGRAGLFFMQPSPEAPALSDVQFNTATMAALGDQLIPSAEAAASMALAEESFSPPAERELLESIRSTREKLAQLEKSLNERESEAKAAEVRAAERIAQLEKLELRIQDLLQQEESIKSKKIKRLTAVYEGMKAEKAAPVIAQMQLSTVVKMFLRMDEKQVGKILSFMTPEKAVIISHELTKQISQVQP